MDFIGFPKNLPEEFKANFASAYNEIIYLREKVNSLQRALFLKRSERFVKQEFILPVNSLFDEAEKIVEEHKEEPKKPEQTEIKSNNNEKKEPNSSPKGGKRPLSQDLPREIKIHDLLENEKICKFDHTSLVLIGEDIVEKLEVVPMTMKVIEHHYLKYACSCCKQNVLKAKAELSIIPGSMAEPGLLSYVVTNKFLFSLPLYRQEELFKQREIEIPRITLARWMIAAGNAVLPIVREIKKFIFSQKSIHCDETTVQVLKGTGKNPSSKNYMWVLASGLEANPAVVFQYYPSRSQHSANHFLADFKGYLHVDGYDGYNSFCALPGVTRVACWAHVRRKFETAFQDGAEAGKSLAEKFLIEIKKLFLIEREGFDLTPEERLILRKQKSQPVIYAIRKLIDENVTQVLPRSKLGTAFGYLSNEWIHLLEFLNSGFISLSNNRVENAIRPFAIGRKNWLFSQSVSGAEASAALYSLVISAKENNLHIENYLTDLFKKIPIISNSEKPDYTSLLPWNWSTNSASE